MTKAKALYTVGYTTYVLGLQDAVTVAEILGRSEVYEEKWRKGEKPNTHHIYDNVKTDMGTIRLITDTFYNMAKLAGPPTEEA